jgi:hypothetical protein
MAGRPADTTSRWRLSALLVYGALQAACAEPAPSRAREPIVDVPISVPAATGSSQPFVDEPPPPKTSPPVPNEGGYTCAMHPQVHQVAPGTCAICGMDLVERR